MESVLSVDCGIRNLGASLWRNGKLSRWWLIQLAESDDIVSQIQEASRRLRALKEETGDVDVLLVEQQPHINRRSCMVHDLVVAAFSAARCFDIHPSRKNQYKPSADQEETGRWTKRNTKTIAKEYFTPVEWKDIGKKKDDVADSVVQFLYWNQTKTVI